MNKKTHKAFSLIEISIVVIVIGVLIAGATGASVVVDKSRIRVARALTESSPVYGISDLELWLETTSIASFRADGIESGTQIQNWYEIGPSIIKSTASAGSKAQYQKRGINNLPSLRFAASYYVISAPFFKSPAPTLSNNYSIFVVLKTNTSTNNQWLFYARQGTAAYPTYPSVASTGIRVGINRIAFTSHTNGGMGDFLSYTTPMISSDRTNMIEMQIRNKAGILYLNEKLVAASGAQNFSYMFPSNYIGGNYTGGDLTFSGDIGEIIIFGRVLSNEERADLGKYLKKKWGIS
ncbi:MAG: prepilin-type N-terminal cleavage/methylation domain-containing protein [Proteobacteria bacterium]|nr:prepilin-type N-terminal cleavage/methylation domain-containing protein [Pseudomonadota bacterium]